MDKPTIQKYYRVGHTQMIPHDTGMWIHYTDLAPYVEQKVQEAVEVERKRFNRSELTMHFGHGGIACGAVKRDGAFGILFRAIEPVEIGQDLLVKRSPVDINQPSVFLRFENVQSAAVLLECVSTLIRSLCGLPVEDLAAVRAAQEKVPEMTICPRCHGSTTIWMDDSYDDNGRSTAACPLCRGVGKIAAQAGKE